MSERKFERLIKIGTGDNKNHVISYKQRRKPFYEYPGNGYGYGPTSGSFPGHTIDVRRYEGSQEHLSLHHDGVNMCGSSGLVLGAVRNQVDICMWGVPPEAEIVSDMFGPGEIRIDEGVIEHIREGMFDRRIIVPILAGTLSLHLSQGEFNPAR